MPDCLDCVRMEQNAALAADCADFGNGHQRADFVVAEHD